MLESTKLGNIRTSRDSWVQYKECVLHAMLSMARQSDRLATKPGACHSTTVFPLSHLFLKLSLCNFVTMMQARVGLVVALLGALCCSACASEGDTSWCALVAPSENATWCTATSDTHLLKTCLQTFLGCLVPPCALQAASCCSPQPVPPPWHRPWAAATPTLPPRPSPRPPTALLWPVSTCRCCVTRAPWHTASCGFETTFL